MAHVDILDEREHLGGPMLASAGLHAGLLAAALLGTWMGGPVERWGERNGVGGAVGVNPVRGLPMPVRTGEVNPVANDTESRVPQPPPQKKAIERGNKEDPEAVALKMLREKRRISDIAAANQRYRSETPRDNQLYSTAGRAMVSPMLGRSGSGGVGVGTGSPLGDRFGAYAAELQRRIAEKWTTNDVDPRLRTAPPTIVTFTILRDGAVQDVRVKQSSGNQVLDLSAQRAVYNVGRVAPLPLGYDRDQATVEFWFELKR